LSQRLSSHLSTKSLEFAISLKGKIMIEEGKIVIKFKFFKFYSACTLICNIQISYKGLKFMP